MLRTVGRVLRSGYFTCSRSVSSSAYLRQTAEFAGKSDSQSNLSIDQAFVKNSTTLSVVLNDQSIYDLKHIWLRDNCSCSKCVHSDTKQKLIAPAVLSLTIKPIDVSLVDGQMLKIVWNDDDGNGHVSIVSAKWLRKNAACFVRAGSATKDVGGVRNEFWDNPFMWDSEKIALQFPEMDWEEFGSSKSGVLKWIGYIRKYGLALVHNVPPHLEQLGKFVEKFAYVKETSYGKTFQVRAEPNPKSHLAFTGRELALHTDMNYRENSPGLQLLQCLEHQDLSEDKSNATSGESVFVDGFAAAKILQERHPAAFSVLSSIPVTFAIDNLGQQYSAVHKTISVDEATGEIEEVHLNDRTLQPLQCHSSMVLPFYHAYQRYFKQLNTREMQVRFNLKKGDVIAFNNRRILHGRAAYNPATVKRHLQGCYVDLDEVQSAYHQISTEILQ